MNEQSPLIGFKEKKTRKDIYANISIALGLTLFVGLIGSVLVRIPLNVFTYHPIFMTFFIVLITEGIALLQPTSTTEEKKKGLKYHSLIQSTSYIFAIIGVSFIFYNKIISGKAHFESVHGKLGVFTFIFLFVQVIFGVTIGMIPITIYGSIDKAKSLWKYHRVLGYTLLLFVWITAQLGVRADYMYNNMYSTNLIYLHWVSFIFVFLGITYRTRISKWGIQSLFN